jgi:hypothetical protein
LERIRLSITLALVTGLYPDWHFAPEDIDVLIDTPDQAFAEYISHPTAAATVRKIDHLFMGRIVVKTDRPARRPVFPPPTGTRRGSP